MALEDAPITLATTDDPTAWARALTSPHNVFQTWEYCSALQHSYAQKIHLIEIRSPSSSILCTYYERTKDGEHYDICSPYGYGGLHLSGDRSELASLSNELVKFFKKQEYVALFQMGQQVEASTPNFIRPHRSSYILDISNIEETWRRMNKNYRNEVNQFRNNSSLKFVIDKQLLKEPFKELYYQTLKRVNANSSYHFSKETLDQILDSDVSMLAGVEDSGTIEIVDLFLCKGGHAEYFLNASSVHGRAYAKPLIWNAAETLSDLSFSTLHLGGGVKENDSLSDFKRRFGSAPIQIAVWKEVIQPKTYDKLCRQYQVKDSKSQRYFPAYWG